jgi:hypothetical protein
MMTAEQMDAVIAKDHAKLLSDHRVLKKSSQGTIGMLRVQIASLKKDKARLRNEWAGIEMCHAEMRLDIAQWESRTGLNIHEVLKGEYGKPWGIYGHGELTNDSD